MTQHYTGTKIVEAWPQEKDGRPGYAVKYADGYTSWSPAEAFEAAYLPLGHIGNLAPHQQRVLGEKAELANRIDKLDAFLQTLGFEGLPADERIMLKAQLAAMRMYHDILRERVAKWS